MSEQAKKQESQEQNFILNQTIPEICNDSVLNSRNLFQSNQRAKVPDFLDSTKLKLILKINDEYKAQHEKKREEAQEKNEEMNLKGIRDEAKVMAENLQKQQLQQIEQQVQQVGKKVDPRVAARQAKQPKQDQPNYKDTQITKMLDNLPKEKQEKLEKLSKVPKQFLQYQDNVERFKQQEQQLMIQAAEDQKLFDSSEQTEQEQSRNMQVALVDKTRMGSAIVKSINKIVKPDWHRPWKLSRVIAGHQGWIRAIAMDPGNQFFVTGSTDRTIKFWDLASGQLKLTLTGHVGPIRGLAVSHRHPYLFSVSEDKTLRCWDLEQNSIIRTYHGHLSGVQCVAMHPTLDVIASGGRDASVRIWDIRLRTQVHCLGGHEGAVNSLISQDFEPQFVSGGGDSMVRLWDLRAGSCLNTLTNHKKSIRTLLFHHKEYTFASGAPDHIKVWKCPEGEFLRNISGHNSIINTMSLNTDNVLVSGSDNGTLRFYDWKSGHNFQTIQQKPQPGSIAAENGIFCSTFDQSQMRFLTGECDKTIKVYKEDENATPETHPVTDFKIEYDRNI